MSPAPSVSSPTDPSRAHLLLLSPDSSPSSAARTIFAALRAAPGSLKHLSGRGPSSLLSSSGSADESADVLRRQLRAWGVRISTASRAAGSASGEEGDVEFTVEMRTVRHASVVDGAVTQTPLFGPAHFTFSSALQIPIPNDLFLPLHDDKPEGATFLEPRILVEVCDAEEEVEEKAAAGRRLVEGAVPSCHLFLTVTISRRPSRSMLVSVFCRPALSSPVPLRTFTASADLHPPLTVPFTSLFPSSGHGGKCDSTDASERRGHIPVDEHGDVVIMTEEAVRDWYRHVEAGVLLDEETEERRIARGE
ncbi:hypothetical protein JCM6882_004312 [Rhodosporidiobolus microsporus]